MGATSKEKKLKGPPATLDGDLGRQPCTGLPIIVLVGPPRSHHLLFLAAGFFGKKGFFPGI